MKLLFLFTIATLFSAAAITALPQSTSPYYTKNVALDPVVMGFKKISTYAHELEQSQNAGFNGQAINPVQLEQTLFQLAKTLDATTAAAKAEGQLDEHVSNTIYYYSQQIQGDVANVTEGIIAAKAYLAKLGLTDMVVATLQTLVPGFDKLYRAVEMTVEPEYKKVIASLFVSIICNMDSAAEALKPGVQITDSQYCTTYSATGKPDLKNCPNKPWPTLPKTPKSFDECDQSCGNVVKFGYQNSAWSKPSSMVWCTSTAIQPDWTPCTQDWTPKQWVCPKYAVL